MSELDIRGILQDKAWAIIRALPKIEGVAYRPDIRIDILGKSLAPGIPTKRGKGHLHLIEVINAITSEVIVHLYFNIHSSNQFILSTKHNGAYVEELQLPTMINRAFKRYKAKIKAIQAGFTREEFNKQKKCYDEITLKDLGETSDVDYYLLNQRGEFGDFNDIVEKVIIPETNIVILRSTPNWSQVEKMIGKNRKEALKQLRCYFYGVIKKRQTEISLKMRTWKEDAWLPSSFKQCLRYVLKHPPKD